MAKRFTPKDEEEASELNLVPYLDIMMNLIMFMLFTTTGLTQMGMIDISQPGYGGTCPPWGDIDQPPSAEIALLVSEEGFSVMVNGVKVDGLTEGPTIPRRGEGRYDFDQLTAQMMEVKARYPTDGELLLSAGEAIRYDVIVGAMDAVREVSSEGGFSPLFPHVTLGAI